MITVYMQERWEKEAKLDPGGDGRSERIGVMISGWERECQAQQNCAAGLAVIFSTSVLRKWGYRN